VHRGITVRHTDATKLARHAAQLEMLYRRCFTEPPWQESPERLAGFPDRLTAHLDRDGFDGLIAGEVGRLVGVVYGWPAGVTLESGSRFDEELASVVPPALAGRMVAPALVVAELMVDPEHQRRGIGRSLLTRFLDGWPSAWLCTHPDAPAAAMYRHDGWREEIPFSIDGSPMVLFTWQAPD
jgi:GNAT superfamily N-acetyltransferase